MILQNKFTKAYYELAEELKNGLTLECVGDNRPVKVFKFIIDESLKVKVLEKVFLNKFLILIDEQNNLINPIYYFNLTNEKDVIMNVPELIKACNEMNDHHEVKEFIFQKIAKTIKLALLRSKKENYFVAIAILQELTEHFPLKDSKEKKEKELDKLKLIDTKVCFNDEIISSNVIKVIQNKIDQIGELTDLNDDCINCKIIEEQYESFKNAINAIEGMWINEAE